MEVSKYRNDDNSREAIAYRISQLESSIDYYRNPDDDPRGPYVHRTLVAPRSIPPLTFEWNGFTPPEGYSWAYTREKLDVLDYENRISQPRTGAQPRLKRFYQEALDSLQRKLDAVDGDVPKIDLIIREAMGELATRLAHVPGDLAKIEWRDLERIIDEVLKELGFNTILTRPGRDGGFDLTVSHHEGVLQRTYLIEVKHWSLPSRPGHQEYHKLINMVVRQQAEKGLLLSTSGFTDKLLEAHLKVERKPVHLGDSEKIINLCSLYTKKRSGLWEHSSPLTDVLFDDTF